VWKIKFVLRGHWHASMRVSEFVGYRNSFNYLMTTFVSFRNC